MKAIEILAPTTKVAPLGMRGLLFGAAVGALALAATPATAQDAAPAAQEVVSEIIVTATRRGEQLIDVPQSVTAITAESLTRYNIQSFADYGSKIPNLSFNQGSGSGRSSFSGNRGVTIRGMVGNNTTTMYIDDTAIPISQNPRIVDIERVEVLKGPQGTLFGAGAIGGTIRIITRQPSVVDNEVKMMVQGGATKGGGSPDYGANIIGNLVVVPDKVAIRAMGFVNHDSGFVTRTVPQTPGSATLVKYDDEGASTQVGGSLSALWLAHPDLTANLKLMGQHEEYPHGFPVVFRGLTQYDPTTLTTRRDYNMTETSRNSWFLPSLTLTYDPGPFNFVSATSYFYRDARDIEDVSEAMHQVMLSRYGYEFPGGIANGPETTLRNFQQEFRATFDFMGFNGILGAYYSNLIQHNLASPRILPGFAASPQGLRANARTDVYFVQKSRQELIDKSLFGELSYQFFDVLTLAAGVRRYDLEQNTKISQLGFVVGAPTTVNIRNNVQEKGWSPRFNVRYEPNEALTVYGVAAKGFRPGGPGGATATAAACLPDLNRLGVTVDQVRAGYTSDSVWTYEGGVKAAMMDRRFLVTGAAFQTDWKDIQQTVSLSGCGATFIGNAGAAQIRGLELEANGSLTDELTVRFGLGYTDAKITDDNNGSTGQKNGDRLFGVPKWNASIGAIYEREVRPGLTGFVSGDWSYVGSSVTINNSTVFPESRGSYNIVNARIGVRNDQNEVSLYVNNLTNTLANYGDHVPGIAQTIRINGTTVPYARVWVSRPIQVGMQFRRNF